MIHICLSALFAVSVATVDTTGVCPTGEALCRSQKGNSLLQTKLSAKDTKLFVTEDFNDMRTETHNTRAVVKVSQEQLKREALRQETLIEGFVQVEQLAIAAMIQEGLNQADALALARKLAADFVDGEGWENRNLSSDDSYHTLMVESRSPIKTMLCQIRHKGPEDCKNEEHHLFQIVLEGFPAVGSALVQDDAQHEVQHSEAAVQGVANPELLALWEEAVLGGARLAVKIGGDQESVKMRALEVMTRLQKMSDDELLEYNGKSMLHFARMFGENSLRAQCLQTMASCSDTLVAWINELAGMDEGSASASLLQVGVRPVVQLAMKVMGIPERPDETAAERAAATKAYLMQRTLSSD